MSIHSFKDHERKNCDWGHKHLHYHHLLPPASSLSTVFSLRHKENLKRDMTSSSEKMESQKKKRKTMKEDKNEDDGSGKAWPTTKRLTSCRKFKDCILMHDFTHLLWLIFCFLLLFLFLFQSTSLSLGLHSLWLPSESSVSLPGRSSCSLWSPTIKNIIQPESSSRIKRKEVREDEDDSLPLSSHASHPLLEPDFVPSTQGTCKHQIRREKSLLHQTHEGKWSEGKSCCPTVAFVSLLFLLLFFIPHPSHERRRRCTPFPPFSSFLPSFMSRINYQPFSHSCLNV